MSTHTAIITSNYGPETHMVSGRLLISSKSNNIRHTKRCLVMLTPALRPQLWEYCMQANFTKLLLITNVQRFDLSRFRRVAWMYVNIRHTQTRMFISFSVANHRRPHDVFAVDPPNIKLLTWVCLLIELDFRLVSNCPDSRNIVRKREGEENSALLNRLIFSRLL